MYGGQRVLPRPPSATSMQMSPALFKHNTLQKKTILILNAAETKLQTFLQNNTKLKVSFIKSRFTKRNKNRFTAPTSLGTPLRINFNFVFWTIKIEYYLV